MEIRKFMKGSTAVCSGAPENDLRGLVNGRTYTIVESNHTIDGDEYIVVNENRNATSGIRVKAKYFF